MQPDAGALGATIPVSVVIPVRDEVATLDALLDGLLAQTAPPQEVVVVDGGSTDGTAELLRVRAADDDRLVVVSAGPATPGRGRNLGVATAGSPWLAFVDAGIRVEPTWLERLWTAHLGQPESEVVYGNYEFDLHSGFERRAAVAYGEPKVDTPRGPCRGPSVVSVLLSRVAFDRAGGFVDSRSGEDEMFTRAVRERGLTVGWAPDATVWWRLRPDLPSTFERFRSYSYHYALAGEQRHWQRPLLRGYAPLGLGLLLAATRSPWWGVLPVATIAGRTSRRLHRQADVARGLGPVDVVGVAAIMLATDLATFLGWAQASRARRRR